MKKSEKYKSNLTSRIMNRPIIAMLIGLTFVTVILAAVFTQIAKGLPPERTPFKGTGSNGNRDQEKPAEQRKTYDREFLGVIKGIEGDGRKITLFDIDRQVEMVLNYNGATDIRDKFGQIIAIGQLKKGMMVDTGYSAKGNAAEKIHVSDRIWEYVGSKNFYINKEDRIITVGNVNYKYTDDLIVVSGDELTIVTELAQQDELTIRGYDQTVCSIDVIRGHGTIRLTDVHDFKGGSIVVGNESMQQIEEGMELTIREGSFNLTVENGVYNATKNIEVERNKQTEVSLDGLGPNAVKRGKITFEIYPFGADLFIDGELRSYANPIELKYGEHKIEVSLGGYTTYLGTLNVDSPGKNLQIRLPDKSSGAAADVKEDDTEDPYEEESNTWELPSPGRPSDEDSDGEIPEEDDPGEDPWEEEPSEDGDEESEEPDEIELDDEGEYIRAKGHSIYIQSPVGASVYLNGEFLGIVPGSFDKIIGRHVLTFIREGYETKSYTVELLNDGMDSYFNMPELIKKVP